MNETHNFFLLRSLDKSENPTDEAARTRLRDALIGEHISIVETVVRRVFSGLGLNKNNDFEDAVSEGTIALILAVDSFDPEYGVPFKAYAALSIANHVRSYAANHATLSNRRTGHEVETGFVDDLIFVVEDFASQWTHRQAIIEAVARAIELVEASLGTERDVVAWERQKRALNLRFTQNQTVLAVALDLGISPKFAQKVIERGYDRLRPHLATLLADTSIA